jgi:DNA repair protein RecN (Recombination protein N)
MLRSLSIRNLILIDRLDLTFDEGLCVLTGETGAGKSILLEALGLALGARVDGRLLQPGTAQASVTAGFQLVGDHPVLEILSEHGLDATEGGLILRRTVGTDGRSRAFVNDQPASVGLLRTLGAAVLEIQGQFEQHGLLDGARHRVLLDAFGGLSGGAAETARLWQDWRIAAQACAEAERDLAAARSEETILRHAVDELQALDPQPGEAAALTEQRTRLMHREQLVEAMNAAVAALAGGGAAAGADQEVSDARLHLERAAERAGGGLDPVIAALDRAAADLADSRIWPASMVSKTTGCPSCANSWARAWPVSKAALSTWPTCIGRVRPPGRPMSRPPGPSALRAPRPPGGSTVRSTPNCPL